MLVFNTAEAVVAVTEATAPNVMLVVRAAVVVAAERAVAAVWIDVTRDALAVAMPPTDADGKAEIAAISIE